MTILLLSLRKKIIEGLMNRWNEDIQLSTFLLNLVNPPYASSLADHISERHMPLPQTFTGTSLSSNNQKTMGNREIREKLISEIQKME